MIRDLSTYAFNNYGNDAKLYNGIHDLESALAARALNAQERADIIERCAQIADEFVRKYDRDGQQYWHPADLAQAIAHRIRQEIRVRNE